MTSGPWAFHLHLAAWVLVVAVGALYLLLVRASRDGVGTSVPPTGRQWWQLAGALGSLAVALTWPLSDIAAQWSLTALLVQRLLLMLVTAPLLLLATPTPVLGRLTRPWPVDVVVDFLSRVPVSIVVFTVIVVGTLSAPAVAAQASSGLWRGFFDGLLLFAGVVLWVPALRRVPGARRASPVAVAVYLVVQSVLPNFPAIVFVFARHPLYGAYAHAHQAIGLSALNDQQVAGIVAKVATLPVLWWAAWRALSRAERAERTGGDEEPLTWADVERALERTERDEKRSSQAT